MTSRERLYAASRREPVDTIPIAPRLGYAAIHHCGSASNQNALRLKQTYDYDPFLEIRGNTYPFNDPFCGFLHASDVTVDLRIVDKGTMRRVERAIHTPEGKLEDKIVVPNPGEKQYGRSPNPQWIEHMVKGPEDLNAVRRLIPPVDPSPAYEYHGWNATAGEEGICRCLVYGPLDHQAGQVVSIEDLMVDMMTGDSFASQLIDMFWHQIMEQTKALCENGVRFFRLSWYWESLSAGWSPRIYREKFVPRISEQVALIHSYNGTVDFYDDGKCMKVLPSLVETGIDILETCTPPPTGDFDLEHAVRTYGDRLTFMGYIDLIYVLQQGDVEDVEKAVHFACEIGREGGGFILGTSDSMREGTPIENIDAYFDSGRKYGRIV